MTKKQLAKKAGKGKDPASVRKITQQFHDLLQSAPTWSEVQAERKRKLAALGKEPIDLMAPNGVRSADMLDDIYHTETWQAMQVKLATYGMTLQIEDHVWLCNTLAYHYGFWPHTRLRFKAYCQLVQKDPECLAIVEQRKFVNFVKREAEYLDKQMKIDPLYDVPGRRDELKAWLKLLDVMKRCQKRNDAIKKSRKKKLWQIG